MSFWDVFNFFIKGRSRWQRFVRFKVRVIDLTRYTNEFNTSIPRLMLVQPLYGGSIIYCHRSNCSHLLLAQSTMSWRRMGVDWIVDFSFRESPGHYCDVFFLFVWGNSWECLKCLVSFCFIVVLFQGMRTIGKDQKDSATQKKAFSGIFK